MSGITKRWPTCLVVLPLSLLFLSLAPASSAPPCVLSNDHRPLEWPRPYEVRSVDTYDCRTSNVFVPVQGGFSTADLYSVQPRCAGEPPEPGEFIGRIGAYSYKYRVSGAELNERTLPGATRATTASLRYTRSEPHEAARPGLDTIQKRLHNTTWSVACAETASLQRCNVDADRWSGDEAHTVFRFELNEASPSRICAFRNWHPDAAPVLYIDRVRLNFGPDAQFEGLRFKCKNVPDGFEQQLQSTKLVTAALGPRRAPEERKRVVTNGFAEAMQLARWLMTELKARRVIDTVEPPALKEAARVLESCPVTRSP